MKKQLRDIYADVSNGKLSQNEALAQIKAIKLQGAGKVTHALLVTPVWQQVAIEASAGTIPFTEHHVVWCERSPADVEMLGLSLPHSRCMTLQAGQQESIAQHYSEYALACFERIKIILQGKPQGNVLIQIVVADQPEQALLAGLSGLLKTASLENPRITGQFIFVASDMGAEELAWHLEEEKTGGWDPLVRYQHGEREVLRWQDVPDGPEQPPIAFNDRGVYLITGGLGGLAVLFAKEIVDRAPQARVVLAGRSTSRAAAETLLGESSWQAGRVSYRQMDVGDLAQVKQVITAVRNDHGQLNGILHTAGMIADDFILKKSGAQFREVLAPKVTGTFNLDEASRDVELDFFVLFSSFAGALGNVGQADYAAANGFMDQFSAYRNRQVAAGLRHGRTRSINWPLWRAGGMGNDPKSREILEQATGLQPMRTATGMRTFYHSLALPYDQLMVAEGDLTQMRRALLTGRPIQRELPPSVVAAEPSGDDLLEQTQNYLRREFSEMLKLPSHRIDPQVGLEKYGIDSILAMKLTSRLEKTFNSLPKTLFFEYQTVQELTQYFVQSHGARLATLFPGMNNGQSKTKPVDAPTETLPPAEKRTTSRRFNRMPGGAHGQTAERDPIAIIGLSGRYPEAVDIEAFWRNLRDGKDCIIEVPKDRWDWQAYFSDDRTRTGQHYSKWGGFISGIGEFDPLFFNISPKDAKYIDPQERLFLQHAWMAIEDAGYTRASLQVPCEHDLAGQVGVYAGVMYSEYQLLGVESSLQGKPLGVAGSAASIANRVSYALNLHGPSMTLDTMCSSSLTAIHLACQDLKLGRTSLGIAGGVNVSIHPNKYLMLSAGQFISSDGHCQSFGEGGDGYIPGEGVGVVVLKRLSDATRDGDHIYGVIRGSALNHGGKTNGYTVPNPQAQATAISRALAESHTDARHISYIEAHGTGTKLGDPIEIAALSKAFQRQTDDTEFCLIGSAKSNIGHCESAAGIAGLTKVLLQMQHQQIVPSLHSAQLNPHIDFHASPFVVSQTLRPWEQPVIDGQTLPRIAGISSFGAGGSNAHMIIEEYQAPAMQATVVAPVVILLSARTAEQLQQKVGDLLHFVLARLSTINLESMAYTLQLGREPMDERLGIIVSSVEQLAETLQAYGSGQQAIEDAYRGDVKRNRDALSAFSGDPDLQQTVEKWITGRKFPKLLDLWVKGLDVDWSKLYGQPRPRRMSLPTYPFARERYWIDVVPVTAQAAANAVLHPLLHTNTSDMLQQGYSSIFSGDEWFLSAPAAAYLEMARAAVHNAARTPREAFVELRDIVWAQPIVIPAKKQVDIALLANGPDEIDFEIYSEDADSASNDEIVHCQGRAVVSLGPAPAAVDLDQLERGGQRLVSLRLPQEVEKSAGDFFLHPTLIDMALQAAGVRLPVAIETLRIVEPCGPEMTALVRTVADKIDIDLCDPRGSVAVQMRGISWRERASETIEPVAVPKKIAVTVREPREIAFAAVNQSKSAPVERPERSTISLSLPRKEKTPQPLERRSSITLSSKKRESPGKNSEDSVASSVRLYELGDGIFSIRIGEASTSAEVVQALERAQQEGSVKVLLISGLERAFGPGGRESHNEAIEQKLYRTLAAFPFPVIAVLQDDAIGPVFMAAALCDFMIWNEDASYGYSDGERGFYPTTAEETLFCERFGDVRAQDLLYLSATSTGKQLRRKGWTCPIVPTAAVEAYAQQLSSTLATKPQEALRLLKQHLTRNLVGLVEGLTTVGVAEPEEETAVRKAVTAPAEHVRVETPADSVLAITFGIADARDVVTDLGRIFSELQEDSWYKAIVLSSDDPEFLFAVPDDVVLDVKRLIGESKIPVVAALTRNAKGNAWLAAQFCDACVYSRDGVYSTANLSQSQTAAAVFAHRLGSEAANEILLTGADYSGGDLQQRASALRVAERDHVVAAAVDIAEHLARLPRTALASWKSHTATTLQQKIQAMPAASASAQTDDVPASLVAPVRIALHSNVVTATAFPDGIVVVTMEDREARNMFSDAFMKGITEAFAHIEQTPAYKVVILTGYDSYFASGGTKESLLAVQQGKTRFTDFNTQLALDCKLPVIAAMQGHGIGAGWALGMFADVVILSEESRYLSPYMDYGFTPGAGATCILPERMGTDLARESLLTAQPYSGRDLRERGLALRVLPRVDVYAAAMALAGQMAHASRGRLIGLKQQLTAYLHASLEETYRLELAMHETTFVGRPETLARIQRSFFPEIDARPAEPLPPRVESTVPSPVPSRVPAGGSDVLAAVTATLRTLLANELQMRESDVDEHAKFVDLGLESIGGVTWVRKINEKYQTSIDPTTVYSYPTLADFSRFVREEAESRGMLSHTVAMPAAAAPVASAKSPSTQYQNATKLTSWRSRAQPRFVSSMPVPPPAEAIAIIGIAGQFPQARNLDEFWQNIAQGRNCITQVPPERWDVNTWYQSGESAAGKTNSKWFGALEEYDLFDPLFFNISPRDAESMDPQQRLFLQACWHSIENAGYDARSLSGSKCGVFAGCAYGDYHLLSRDQQLSAQGFTGDATSILAGRVSYVLNLQGPCFTLDTACSSSLVAIAQACDSLVSGASNLALAGGVYVMAGPEMHVKSSQVGMLSPDGKCYSFDQRANGFVPGEGVGVVLLKRLTDAERDGDVIQAVIQGWGVNQDGKTNGITAPNTESQTRLEQDVYDRYTIDPGNIQLVEAHGTGTMLGDPIEVRGLKKAFEKYTQNKEYCALGSVKSNIGHCLTAAGIAGVAKVVMALRHKQLPPTINFEHLNEHIDLTNSPFYVNSRLQPWEPVDARPRQAAISAFGFSGTNAHMVIAEYVPAAVMKPAVSPLTRNEKVVIPLSARTAGQLMQKAVDLRAFIGRQTQSIDLDALAYTLQMGRDPMEERLGILVRSVEELAEKLEAWISGEADIADLHQAQVKRSKQSIAILSQDDELREAVMEKCFAGRKLSKLMELWVKGLEVEWNRLYDEAKPQRISLPLYPFAKERYWIDVPVAAPVAAGRPWLQSARVLSSLHRDKMRRVSVSSATRGIAAARSAPAARNEIVLQPVAAATPVAVERKKPAIALAAPRASVGCASPSASTRPSVTLANSPFVLSASTARLYDSGNGLFSIDIAVTSTIAHLREALDRAQQEPSLKVLMLNGIERCFSRRGREDYNEAVEQQLYRSLVAFPYPVIGVVDSDAIGAGFLAAALCDFMVCSEDASYGYLAPTVAELAVFSERFGDALAQDFLYRATPLTGKELRARGWTCPVMPPHEVAAYAGKLASTLATKPRDALHLLKQHLARHLAELASELTRVEVTIHAEESAGSVRIVAFRDASDLLRRVADVQQDPESKAIVLASEDSAFLSGISDDVVLDLQRLIMESEIPIVAALTGNASGNAWLITQFCDAAVYNRLGVYSASNLGPVQTAAAMFRHRFGAAAGSEILLTGADYSGADLLRRAGTITVAEHDDVLAAAVRVAEVWATLPRVTLAAWKKQAAGTLDDKIRCLPAVAGSDEISERPIPMLIDSPTQVALHSRAVTATAHPEGIVVVKMEDREAKNMFSDAFVEGVAEAFAHIEQTPAYKVVVLTGFDSYFASGGTKEGLVAIQQGKARFTDFDIHQSALNCKLPVIAAMQGHGIGAGWCLGMFADIVLLSEESRYVSPYMDYGFTPGAGATFILADKIGQDLARESMLTAQYVTGSELKARGLLLPILPRADVVPAAMALARQIARVSRGRLIGLKQLLSSHVHQALAETYRLELAMHEKTFVGHAGTLAQIQSKFDQEIERPQVAPQLATAEPASPFMDTDVLRAVTTTLRSLIASELHLHEGDIDEDVEFVSLGLDSISAVTLIRNVNAKYRTSIEATKIYRYPTLAQLGVFVKEEAEKNGVLPNLSAPRVAPRVADAPAQPKIVTSPVVSKRTGRRRRGTQKQMVHAPATQASDAIAIIGMSGRFPGAQNLDEYWQNIAQGRNSVTEVPPARWDINRYAHARWLGVLDDVDRFDPLFFRISPQEAEYIDPQHRLFLQESYKAFEDAGYASNSLSNKRCGVYLGISNNDYSLLLQKQGVQSTPVTSNSFAVAAARIAYYLNLKGPAISVDTACSSSLVAIHLACQGLLSGETDMALAGGVTLWLTPDSHLSMSEAGMLSAAGQCKTFDDSADGIVLGDGVGAVVLKRLKDAQADHDVIHGVILGSGINQDGRTNGITAPSVNSQIELERSVYARYEIDPGTITYVEAHGTGTKLGDPIELEALAAAFQERTDRKNYCALGSVKSNIGHTASAAGVASVLKVLLSMRHRMLAPTLHVTKENAHFDFSESPFYIGRETQAWETAPGSRRRAAVSAFGYSGTNAHLVIEEWVPPVEQALPSENGPFIVPLSARTAEQLRQKAHDLADFLRTVPMPVDLQSVAYTLQAGRDAMDERAVFVVSSVDQLIGALTGYVNGEKGIEYAWQGRVDSGSDGIALMGRDDDVREAVDKWIEHGKYAKLAELWSRGLNFDWNKLYGGAKPHRVSLPTYPFARERFWIDKTIVSPADDELLSDIAAMGSIEDILSRIDGGAMETDHALRLLKMLV